MARIFRLALLSTSAFLFLVPVSLVGGGRGDPPSWLGWLGDREFEAAGLSKLTEEELEVLGSLWLPADGPSFLEHESQAYLHAQGWRPVYVGGCYEASHERFVLVLGEDGPAMLKAWSIIDPLPVVGVHWAKETAGSWDILGPGGTSTHYSER